MYYDLLPKIKNAEQAGKAHILTPFSKMDFDVAKILLAAKYIGDVQKKTVGNKNYLEIALAGKSKKGMIAGFKIVSKPSRHIYLDLKKIRPVKQGYGIAVISTSKGVMSDKDVRRNKVGGEYLFEIW